MVNECFLEKQSRYTGNCLFPSFLNHVSSINFYRTWNAAGCFASCSSACWDKFFLFALALFSNKAIMNLIINTLINNFITYLPFSFHLKFYYLLHFSARATPIKKPGRFVDRASLFDTVLQFRLNTTWSYSYRIFLFATIEINHHFRICTRMPLDKSSWTIHLHSSYVLQWYRHQFVSPYLDVVVNKFHKACLIIFCY